MASVMEALVKFATETRFEDLPKEVIHETKRIILDCVGCTFGGLSLDKGKIAIEFARRTAGTCEATVIGTGDRLSYVGAAFANGEMMNALDYEDMQSTPGHVSPFVIPAPLALAEGMHTSGKTLICALAVAHEISVRFGHALAYLRDIVDGKLKDPPVWGSSSHIFGGTAAASMILELDSSQMAQAMGIAGYICPVQPVRRFSHCIPSPMSHYQVAGWTAQAELTAALLAQLGYTGDAGVLEGEYGFWRFIGSSKWNPDVITKKLGESWLFPAITKYKFYPCCSMMHTILDCFIHIINSNSLQPDDIDEVEVYLDPGALRPVWMNREIRSEGDTQFSVAYVIAVAAHRVPVGPEWQTLAVRQDPKILEFMKKIKVDAVSGYVQAIGEDPISRPGMAKVMARGKTFVEQRKYCKGMPATKATYATDDELVQKFRHQVQFSNILPTHKIEKAIKSILELEKMDDVSLLMKVLSL